MSTRLTDRNRHHDLSRALQLCRALALEALTLEELAVRFDCSTRTIRRTIYLLQASGVDIMSARGPQDQGEDLGEPFARPGELAKVYRLDPRAWTGALYLPMDGGVR